MSVEQVQVTEFEPNIERDDVNESRPSIARVDVVQDEDDGSGGGGGGGSLVMKANSTTLNAYVTKDLGSDQAEVWVSFGLAIPTATLALWSSAGSGDPVDVFSSSDDVVGALLVPDATDWQLYSQSSLETGAGPPFPSANVWQNCELHVQITGTTFAEWFVDGTSLVTFTNGDTLQIRKVLIGQQGAVPDPDSIVYIRNVKVGTTRGGSELFADDFSSGNLSSWDTITSDCTVVPDPFP